MYRTGEEVFGRDGKLGEISRVIVDPRSVVLSMGALFGGPLAGAADSLVVRFR